MVKPEEADYDPCDYWEAPRCTIVIDQLLDLGDDHLKGSYTDQCFFQAESWDQTCQSMFWFSFYFTTLRHKSFCRRGEWKQRDASKWFALFCFCRWKTKWRWRQPEEEIRDQNKTLDSFFCVNEEVKARFHIFSREIGVDNNTNYLRWTTVENRLLEP